MRLAAIVAITVCASSAPAAPRRKLTKDDVRVGIKRLVPKVSDCYAAALEHDPKLGGGVFNIELAFDSKPGVGIAVAVRGFDTTGALGQSSELRVCATAAFDGIVLSPVAAEGTLEMFYPITFAARPPDNRDAKIVAAAKRAAAAGRWREALRDAERGLELTSLDGTMRRPLIEIAGVAACNLGLEAKARHYTKLASSKAERAVRAACARAGTAL